jgi:hypothetical protein
MLAQHEILSGERDYEQALDIVINTAERELLIFDQDFSRGAYAGVARYQALRDFLSRDSRNRLSIVLQDVGYFVSRCPRLYGLLSIYGHAMTVHETGEEAKAVRDCFVVADRRHYLRRFHVDQARFRYARDDGETAQLLQARFEELMQSASRFAATRLGL